jgi:DNA-binding MarR family transcriptional regulator
MDTEEITKKLQRAYHSMVDVLDDLIEKGLIEKEGKSLKEAVELAQLKLSDWKELTREEVEKVSTEVKQDLSSLGKTLYEARQVIREKLALDAEYLKETSLEKLNRIADKASLELAQFREDLCEKTEENKDDEHETAHREHQ